MFLSTQRLNKEINALPAFQKYLKYGYYPYYQEDIAGYGERVLQTFNTVIESDLPNVESIDFYSINRIKKLFYILFGNGSLHTQYFTIEPNGGCYSCKFDELSATARKIALCFVAQTKSDRYAANG